MAKTAKPNTDGDPIGRAIVSVIGGLLEQAVEYERTHERGSGLAFIGRFVALHSARTGVIAFTADDLREFE